MAATLVYPFLLNYLGFILATTAVVYVMLAILGFRNPLRGLLLALALTVFCFIVFAVYLGVACPEDPSRTYSTWCEYSSWTCGPI